MTQKKEIRVVIVGAATKASWAKVIRDDGAGRSQDPDKHVHARPVKTDGTRDASLVGNPLEK
jgi:hypothetical protein